MDYKIIEQYGVLVFIITAAYILKIIYFRGVVRENCNLIMKVLFNLTFPCVIFKALANTHTLTLESLAMFVSGFIFQISSGVISFILFKFVLKSEVLWQVQFGGCIGLNIGLFLFPVIETLDPQNGISLAILFNMSNDVACYFVLRPLFALIEGTKELDPSEKDDLEIELHENVMKDISTMDSTPPIYTKGAIPVEISPHPEKVHSPAARTDSTRTSVELSRTSLDLTSTTFKVRYGDKDIQGDIQPNFNYKELLFTILKAIVTCVPLYAMPAGYAVGLTNTPLPHFVTKLISIIAGGNTLLSFVVLGLFFEWKNKTRVVFIALRAVILRVIIGATVGLALFYSLAGTITTITRSIILLCCLCPAPLLNIIYSVEYKAARLDVSAAIVSFSVVSGFISTLLFIIFVVPN
ncbi:hypothetical protein EIN_250310 [Entamoeba invadens IP1]|uniref:Auxin efflux carrier family protein n=1 Tax=Entamoeba invadens IP1 TaxID=370355 RepID=A0A0A1UH96_ENTIV|nr:hypothetical protein EIN_250310 [Entamoeba invadens IP1]ELP94937.1 hypothetical protein EIN_250310 [Entamoeba invadens IP1]|eukprot:XP_004261708.1 hypothetical protein EIN_250310 [Entamoeba invadens IP1]